jgi:hypothetical protein
MMFEILKRTFIVILSKIFFLNLLKKPISMKKFSFFFVAVAALLVLQTSCKKAIELCFDFAKGVSYATGAVTSAGPKTFTKTLTVTDLIDQITSKGVKSDNVNSVKVNAITLTIPSTAGYTFDDISAAELLVNGISLGTLPTTATGLTATFAKPSVSNLKATFLGTTDPTMTLNATFKKAVAASTIEIKLPINMCYEPL